MDLIRHRIALSISLVTAGFLVAAALWRLHHHVAGPSTTDYGAFLLLILLNLRQPFQRPMERATLGAIVVGVASFILIPWPLAQLATIDLAASVLLACYLLRITFLTVPGEASPEA